jgi:hypothetical protein
MLSIVAMLTLTITCYDRAFSVNGLLSRVTNARFYASSSVLAACWSSLRVFVHAMEILGSCNGDSLQEILLLGFRSESSFFTLVTVCELLKKK